MTKVGLEVRSDEGRSIFVRLSLPLLDAVARAMLGLLVLLAYMARIVDEEMHIYVFFSFSIYNFVRGEG